MTTQILTQHYEVPQNGLKIFSNASDTGNKSESDHVITVKISNAVTHEVGRWTFTDYEINVKANLPNYAKESRVRRRYNDFVWLHEELKKHTLMVIPELPKKKATFRSIPLLNRFTQTNFDPAFVEERRGKLEEFLTKVAQHPLAQQQICLQMFLQDEFINRKYTPGLVKSKE